MDNLGAIGGPLLALALDGLIGVRGAILLSIIPGLLAAAAIVYARRRRSSGVTHKKGTGPMRNSLIHRPVRALASGLGEGD